MFHSELSTALGGLVLGLDVLISGTQGAGKSTLCAELAARMAQDLDGLSYWLDAEQNKDLVAALFARSGSPMNRIGLISRHSEDRSMRPLTWREAFARVPRDAVVAVVDSLQRWAPRAADQTELLAFIRPLPFTVLVISHATKSGQVSGRNENQHDTDAVAFVKQTEICVTKCRWTPTPRSIPRKTKANGEVRTTTG
jgi:predicted ATP-dependent serine protease